MNCPRMGTLLALAALTLVTACGVKGDLERPGPLWNSEEAIRSECQRQLESNEEQDPRCAQHQSGAQTHGSGRDPSAPFLYDAVDPQVLDRTPSSTPPTGLPEVVPPSSDSTPQ